MISRSSLRTLIDEAEFEYRRCWETLCRMKQSASRALTAEDLLNFQPTLARPLFELDKMYRALHQERKGLIARKDSVSRKWFEHRLRLIRDYQEALKQAISVGKALGDSFVWFFYHKQREYLLDHYKHERIFHTPPGIGGLGELEFVERIRLLKDQLVIYHGITTFLRLGDISLVDMKTLELTAIGELKTEKVGPQRIRITILVFGPEDKRSLLFDGTVDQEEPASEELLPDSFPQNVRERLNRQIESMVESLKVSEPDTKMRMDADLPIDELTTFSRSLKTSSMTFQKVGDGLVLVGFLDGRRSLYSRLMRGLSFDLSEKIAGAKQHVQDIIKPGSEENMILVNDLHVPSPRYQLPLGMTPLFWWPLDLEFIRRVLFREALLFSIYNPAHFVEKLRQFGFAVDYLEKERIFEVKKALGKRMIALKGFDFFLNLIVRQFLSEESVIQIIEDTVKKIEAENIPEDSLVELHIYQHLLL